MVKCGLLGRSLPHSYSPKIHRFLGNYSYSIFEKEPGELEAFLRNGDFTGLNVTTPYKKSVLPYCRELTQTAVKLGAVNTIIRRPDGSLLGHNTDYEGFLAMVRHSGLSVGGKKILVLGSGGASVTVVAVLRELGAHPVVISRTGEHNYQNITQHSDAAIIVNTTPVGMYPNNGDSPVSLDYFPLLEGVLDLVYNPARTQLLLDAENRNLVSENGLWMLVAQAKESAELFTGNPISSEKIPEIYNALKQQTENIILIGMPGCGKTTVAAALAKRLNREMADSDQWIEHNTGRGIPDLLAGGEDAFRKLETQALGTLGKESSLILSTGGGCVTKPENYPLLHQNGRIFWLTRPLDLLETKGRPLSINGDLGDMFRVRAPMYRLFADHEISNDTSIDNTVEKIVNCLRDTL